MSSSYSMATAQSRCQSSEHRSHKHTLPQRVYSLLSGTEIWSKEPWHIRSSCIGSSCTQAFLTLLCPDVTICTVY